MACPRCGKSESRCKCHPVDRELYEHRKSIEDTHHCPVCNEKLKNCSCMPKS